MYIKISQITVTVVNRGVDLTIEVNTTGDVRPPNVTLGPLSYTYTVAQIQVHFGSWEGAGSEHSVNGEFFDGEVRMMMMMCMFYTLKLKVSVVV